MLERSAGGRHEEARRNDAAILASARAVFVADPDAPVAAVAEQDAALMRPGDIPVLIGDPAKIRRDTGWTPPLSFDRTLRDLVDAQAH